MQQDEEVGTLTNRAWMPGNEFSSEALPKALPEGQNNPRVW
jgi:hypothetical protein